MQIKQDPVTGLWCREDGAILMPPTGIKFKAFRWTIGSKQPSGYRTIQFHGKTHFVHQIVCRAFNGLAPEGKPCVDHINRIRDDNHSSNLHWVSYKENNDNHGRVLNRVDYGVRACDDKTAYAKAHGKAYYERHCEERKAHGKAYYEAHCEEIKARQRAYEAAKAAKMKAQGFTMRKGPNGKWGWYPRIRTQKIS